MYHVLLEVVHAIAHDDLPGRYGGGDTIRGQWGGRAERAARGGEGWVRAREYGEYRAAKSL